jgi:lipopolysaccharide transport system permease protein
MNEITNHAAAEVADAQLELPLTRILPPSGVTLNFREMWAYRELLYFLIWRDIKVRYKQTILGVAWAVLQPLLTMVIFSLVFGRLAKMPSDGTPYPVFALAGLVPWLFFANGLNQSSNSLVSNANLITKVYFPRIHIPLASVLSGLVDFFLSASMLAVMMVIFRVKPNIHMLWLPAFLVLGVVTSLGVGLWLSAMNVKFRDIRYVVPFLVQFWFFATPVVYPSSLLSSSWAKMLYGANPMTGVVEGFRWALFGNSPPGPMLAVSALVTLAILFSGAYYFRRTERTFADVV